MIWPRNGGSLTVNAAGIVVLTVPLIICAGQHTQTPLFYSTTTASVVDFTGIITNNIDR
ncbi:hypothetical protein PCAR4_810034 [Paraburkholderia caribensis]|nr:hypothetical protein PCAR4_810034 [Paraburkholderia caribensis]